MRRPITEDDIRRIYRETIDDLYGLVLRRCEGDRDLAEDITQETWLRAVRGHKGRWNCLSSGSRLSRISELSEPPRKWM